MSAGPLNPVPPGAGPLDHGAIGSDITLLASAVSAEFGRARTSSKPQ